MSLCIPYGGRYYPQSDNSISLGQTKLKVVQDKFRTRINAHGSKGSDLKSPKS